MKSKIKKFINSKLFVFIITAIVFSTIGVSAATYFPSNDVTYNNSTSGLESTDVQGAIDELYNKCFPPSISFNEIIKNAGLQKDPNECRYFFTGSNPNNYITFNDEFAGWRIISIECDGTIKIMRNNSIGSKAWDTFEFNGSNNWSRPSDLNTYLNEIYYNELSTKVQNQIVTHPFSTGAVTEYNNDLREQINNENSKKWEGKIALLTASEYLRTNSNSSCQTYSSINSNNSICKNTTWMYMDDIWWTITPSVGNNNSVLHVQTNGGVYSTPTLYTGLAVRPVIYLNNNLKLLGNGTSSKPYTIE